VKQFSGDVLAGLVLLIAMFLVATNWEASVAILSTVFGGTTKLARTLQGR